MSLFNRGSYSLHSGLKSDYKIDCDALSDGDLETIAFLLYKRLKPFSEMEWIPEGGVRLATKMWNYRCNKGGLLIVDDVWTTGGSMGAVRGGREAQGCVIFARENPASWVKYLCLISGEGRDEHRVAERCKG